MEFHLIKNGIQEGPFTVEELTQQGISPESVVWAPGMAEWQQAGDVPELTAVLQRAEFEAAQQAARAAENMATTGQPYEPSVPPTYMPPQAPRYGGGDPEPPKKKSGCTPWLIAALILAILFGTMVLTCPDRQAHETAIQEVTKAWVDDKVDETATLCDETSPYGLTGAVWGRDRLEVEKLTDKLCYAAGNFYINDKPTGAVVGMQPFGGARASGTNDKAGGEFNLIRWIIPRVIKETLVSPTDYRYTYMK